MTTSLQRTPTQVPLEGGEDVTIHPKDPWPSAYRGSEYSIIRSRKHRQLVMAWQYDDLQLFMEPPDGLVEILREVGKGDGKGSFRITAGQDVIVKVPADGYVHIDRAPVSSGWVPVYLGQLEGKPDVDEVNIDPPTPTTPEVAVWEGFPFNHGETWAISVYENLIWKWEGGSRSYRFKSAFDHSDLIQRYQDYRRTPGRLYVTEFGHIWVNIPPDEVPEANQATINKMYEEWRQQASSQGKSAILRLVQRRLEATGDGDSSFGHLPVHIGHVSQFDDGVLPRVVVNDTRYFVEVGRQRTF